MEKNGPAFTVKPFPLSRRLIIDSGRVGKRKHTIHALIEIDVTEARSILKAHKTRSGEAISFTAFLMACLGCAIEQNKYLHARRDAWGRLILFDEVDCATMIEIELEGQKFPLAHIVRAINCRSLRSIHDEIRRVQTEPRSSASLQKNSRFMVAFLLLPAMVRDLFYGLIARSPQVFKRTFGTVMVSSVGMFGSGAGWGLTGGSIYTTNLLLGGIAEKPAVAHGQVAVREYLSMTVDLDHDIIDGAPGARFVERLKTLIESGFGLDEFLPPAADQETTPTPKEVRACVDDTP